MRTKTAKATKTEADVVHPSHLKGGTLPHDWEWVTLGSICRTTSGGTPSRKYKEYFEGDIPWVKSGELPDGPVSEIEEYITGEAVKNSSAKQFPKGTLLIALYGATVGKLGVLTKEAATNQAVCAIFPPDYLETKYLFWYLHFVRPDLIAQAIGGAQPNISQGILRNLLIPVAPPYEQKCIVAEIEKQFSRLDEAVANLKRVKANLKRYKAAVLKAAVEGKLTEDWRKAHSNVEPASKLLERILAERRVKWKGKGKGKYGEPAVLKTTVLPKLPDGWAWTSLEHLLREPLRNGHSAKASGTGHGLRAFTLSAVTQGDFSEENTKLTVAHAGKVADLWAQPGDIYVERSNTPELVGLARLYKGPARFAFIPDLLIRVRIIAEVLAQFVEVCLLSEQVRRYFHSKAQGISGTMPKIDQSVIEKTPLPLPPVQEQGQIVAEVERRLSVIEELEAAVQANLTRADRLRQSILGKAFQGKLIKLNPIHLVVSAEG